MSFTWIKLLVMFNRVKGYIGIIQFVMIGYLFIVNTDFNLFLTLFLVAILSVVLGVLDYKFIFPREQETVALKNPVTQEILAILRRLDNGIHK